VKRCNFYSYDGRKDVTLRNRICEILTKSRKPPKVEDFVSSLKSRVSVRTLGLESRSGVSVRSLGRSRSRHECRCRWFLIVPGGHASMRLKFLAQRYTSINDYRWTFPIIAVHRPKADTAAAMPPWISAAQPSEARAWSNEVGPNPAFPDSYIFSPKWTIFNVRFSARFCQSPENHQKWRIASLVQGFCSYPSSRFGHIQ